MLCELSIETISYKRVFVFVFLLIFNLEEIKVQPSKYAPW